MIEFSDAKLEDLVLLVHQHKCLYDMTLMSHRNKHLKENAGKILQWSCKEMVGNMTLPVLFMKYAFEHAVNKNAVLTADTLYLHILNILVVCFAFDFFPFFWFGQLLQQISRKIWFLNTTFFKN